MPAALSFSTAGTMATGSNGASTTASGLLSTISSIRPSCSGGASRRGMKWSALASSDLAAISLPMRTPRRMGLAGLRVNVAIVSAGAACAPPSSATMAAMQTLYDLIDGQVTAILPTCDLACDAIPSVLGGLHQVTVDRFVAQRLAGFQPVQPFDENEARAVAPHQDGRLLTDLQHALRDLPHGL